MTERDRPDARRTLVHRLLLAALDVLALAVRVAEVHAVDHIRRADVLHAHIFKHNVVNHALLPAPAPGLDAQAAIGVAHQAIMQAHMRDSARHFAAAGHAAMPVFHQAVADFDMLAGRFVALPHVQLARFECNAVIPQGEMRARQQDAIAAFRIEAVGIRAVRRGVDADVQEAQILRKIRLQVPRRRILERHALHGHVPAVIEKEHPRPPRPAPHLAVLPPVALVALPVQHTLAVQHNVLDVHPADKRGVHVQRVALP